MASSPSTSGHFRLSIGGHERACFALFATTVPVATAVVFVHGFGGGPQKTWIDFHNLIDTTTSNRNEWEASDVYFFGYDSTHTSIDDCADELTNFVNGVFPTATLNPTDSAVIPSDILPVRNYENLVLVGHSQGGIIIRWSIANAGQRANHNPVQAPILKSRVALFAPALFGYVPTRWLGVAAAISGLRRLHDLYIAHSPSATEMKDKTFLQQVEKITWECYKQSPKTPAYSAHVLFGSDEQVVVRQKYVQDCRHTPQSGKDHFSICKPNASYSRPLSLPFDDCLS
jgi:pimeloyl-ACP methyl ester carboxylesterase